MNKIDQQRLHSALEDISITAQTMGWVKGRPDWLHDDCDSDYCGICGGKGE